MVGKKVVFERSSGTMQSAMDVGERARTSSETAAPIVAFGNPHAFLLVFRFQVKFLQSGAHPRQFLTSHIASISHSCQWKKRITDVT
jgi:hypothetical protein